MSNEGQVQSLAPQQQGIVSNGEASSEPTENLSGVSALKRLV